MACQQGLILRARLLGFSTYYQAIPERHGLICSMTDGYDYYQNAMAKHINGILKGEFLLTRSK